jgi:class 3 adenylate cyclase
MSKVRSWLGWLVGSEERSGYPDSFDAELAWQSWKIVRVAGIICAVAWLPYLRLDLLLHPELAAVRWLRLGLSVVGVATTLFSLHPSAPRYGRYALFALSLYLECAGGLITGLTGAESNYLGGFLFLLMLVPLAPLPRRDAWTLLIASITIFWISGRAAGMDWEGPARGYVLQDLASTAIVSAVFVHLSAHLRRRHWIKGRIAERQSEEIARDKARIDALLRNILPAPIADELERDGSVKPVFHGEATVVFADFVGFTSKAAHMPPEALVAALDAYFVRFDAIVDRCGVEKLKTIGDAYMYASGLPEPRKTHAIDSCLAALRIRGDVAAHAGHGFGGVRIGIHSGPLMAGMVGAKKFAYDVWGDTVNTASRMESSGESGKINVSSTTADLVGDFFELECRGAVSVKGKGALTMYFLDRIKPELCRDPDGVEPNDAFWERYRALESEEPSRPCE